MTPTPSPIEPAREQRFPVSYTDAQGRQFEGTFHYRRPNICESLRIEAEKARLCEGQALSPSWMAVAHVVAFLRVSLRDSPKWFRWDQLDDVGMVNRVFEEVLRIDGAWFRGSYAPRGGEEAGAAPDEGEDDAVPASPVVDAQVPAAAHE